MADLGAVVEVAQAVNAIGKLNNEVGLMVNGISNGSNHGGSRRTARGAIRLMPKGKAGAEADFSDMYEEGTRKNQSVTKAPACYRAAMEQMAELSRLNGAVSYHAKLGESKALKAVEQARAVLFESTSRGLLSSFHKLIPEPVQPLEDLVRQEIRVMAAMQKQVGLAVDHSEGIVRNLGNYDSDLMKEFDSAKTQLAEEETRYAEAQKAIETKSSQLAQTQMDNPKYVPLQAKINNLLRAEKETKNLMELLGQQVVDTYKQSSQVRAKEDVVRMGLHELRLVHSYVTRFLTFVQRTKQADDLLPQLVETATAVTDAYQILTGIVVTGSTATTEAVNRVASVIGTVDYTIMPTVQREVNKQRSLLEKVDKKTSSYQQAVELLRGKDYQAASAEGRPAAAAPPAA